MLIGGDGGRDDAQFVRSEHHTMPSYPPYKHAVCMQNKKKIGITSRGEECRGDLLVGGFSKAAIVEPPG